MKMVLLHRIGAAEGFMCGSITGVISESIGITKWGKGIRNIMVGISLGLGESSIGEIIELWQSKPKTNMAYLRFAY